MAHAEFLRLLQMVDAGRAVVGRETLQILDGDVVTAEEIDNRASQHSQTCDPSTHVCLTCPECQHIRTERGNLRLKMQSQHQDLPLEVMPVDEDITPQQSG